MSASLIIIAQPHFPSIFYHVRHVPSTFFMQHRKLISPRAVYLFVLRLGFAASAEIGHQRFSAPPLDTPFLLRITRTAHIAITAAADDAHTAISTPCPFVFPGTVPASS